MAGDMSSTTFITVSVEPSLLPKRRGRPIKYANEEERKKARREQVRRGVQVYRAKFKTPPVSIAESSATTSGVAQQSGYPYIQARTVVDKAVNAYQSDDAERTSALQPLSVIQPVVILPPPEDLFMKGNGTLLLNSLLDDFLRATGSNEDWWPLVETSKYAKLAGGLIERSHIAAYSSQTGMLRKDKGLLRIAEAANYETIKNVRKYTHNDALKHFSVFLVMMIHDLVNYQFSEFTRGPDTLPSTAAWMVHCRASFKIMELAGPECWRTGIAARIMLAEVPSIMIPAMGDRRRTFMCSQSWVQTLRLIAREAKFRNTIWEHVVHVPGLMERYDAIAMSLKLELVEEEMIFKEAGLHDLLQQVQQLDRTLDQWLFSYDGLQNEALYSHSTISPTPEDHFLPEVHFSSLDVAEVMMLYWTYKLELAILSSNIESQLARRTPSGESSSNHDAPRRLAYMICKAANYWIKTPEGSIPGLFICFSFPFRIAWRWFAEQGPAYARETIACAEISKRIRQQLFFKVTEHVIDAMYAPPPPVPVMPSADEKQDARYSPERAGSMHHIFVHQESGEQETADAFYFADDRQRSGSCESHSRGPICERCEALRQIGSVKDGAMNFWRPNN